MVEPEKVSKQGKDCKGSQHCSMCHKQVPLSHITTHKQLEASNCKQLQLLMWGGLCGMVVCVCGTWGSASYYQSFPCLLTFFRLYHPCILLISLEIFLFYLFVSFFWAVLKIILHEFMVSQNLIVFSLLFQSRHIFLYKSLSIFFSNLFVFVPSSLFFSYLSPCQHFSTLPNSLHSFVLHVPLLCTY